MTDSARATLGYVAPFAVFVGMMALEHSLGLPVVWAYPARCIVATAVLLAFSRPYLSFRLVAPLASIAIGIAVLLIWIGPDALFGPTYRHFWLFENSITGKAATNIPDSNRANVLFLAFRIAGSTLLVPVIEELFWRGWLMRWIINTDFQKVPMGQYSPLAFWVVAILFASEHGAYWEVGLAAGVIYNWWLVRTRNLADCILAHAVTNGLLAAYVLGFGQWQFWM